ncbi:hypothetical protein FOL47_000130 [Perkinsus chesapeaki]|uniref:Sugar phosphate transporter domain-containing protein n=1 Tax=Perkinsus chesapeaki TaxID=330153 RepID=A0A7J6N186_PERCH|nr:hypothetical protein FOL47_000130 [Perkinsus chesapeaki]
MTVSHPDNTLEELRKPSGVACSSNAGILGEEVKVVGVSSFYASCAILMVVANKLTLDLYAVPFLSLWLQSVLAVICLLTANKAIPMGLTVSQSPSVFVKALFKSFDLCIVNSMSLVFASLCLMRVDASSFQVVARALNTPMSVVLSWLFLPKHSQTTAGLPILGCLLVTAGFMSTVVFDKISVSATGALFTRRLALLYPAPALQHTREAVELPPHTMLSLSLANPVGMLFCDSGAFFLRVSTSTQQGYLRISDAPYSAGPLLGPADDFCRGFKARRYTVQEAETRYDAKPSAVWSPSEPQVSPTRQPADVNEIDSVTSDELTIYRTDAAVEVLRHDRLWRISSNPFYYRGEIPPWRGIEMVLNGDKKDLKTRRVTLRITELERILSFGLTECNAEDCLCRVKYPGVQQEATRRKCADSVGFSTTGKKWDRGRLCQDGVCDMNVGDVISLVLGVDDSGSMFKIVEFIVNGKPCPVTLEAKRSGRLIFKGSGKWSVALLLGESESSESEELLDNDIITPTKPLWQPRPLPSGGGWQDVTC